MSHKPHSPAQLVELAAHYGLILDADTLQVNEAGLDYRVAFACAQDGTDWVLRLPRRPDVVAKLAEERRILDFVGPRLSVAVPRWEVCSERLIAYRRLPGAPGLTLDAQGQPVWHVDPLSREFAAALGRLIAELQALGAQAASDAGVPAKSMSELRATWQARLDTVKAEFVVADELDTRWQAWLDNDALWPEVVAFSHGELYAAHVLIDTPGHIVGVLDWTTATLGDPAVDFTFQHMMGTDVFETTVQAYLAAGGIEHPYLPTRCAEIAAASPLAYGMFALESKNPQHRERAATQLKSQA